MSAHVQAGPETLVRQGDLWELGLAGAPAPPPPPLAPVPTQIALPLGWPADPRDDEFLVTASNLQATELLARWAEWPVQAAMLTGPRKSGRSLLARIWAARSGGAVIDAAEAQAETALFHAWNRAQAERRPLLLIADAAPPSWCIGLPDLRSRIAASPLATLDPPDDALVRALLDRLLFRRGLDARAELIEWITLRIERSHVALIRTVDALDTAALATRRRLSIPLARVTLRAASLITEDP